jgi:general secretion pathway protein G
MLSEPVVHSGRRPSRTGEVNPWLILILIIAAAFGTPILLFFYTSEMKNAQAKLETAHRQLATLQKALAKFHADAGRFPGTAEGMNAFGTPPSDGTEWRECFFSLRRDPWGNPYRYYDSGSWGGADRCRLVSAGPDGKEKTADDIVVNMTTMTFAARTTTATQPSTMPAGSPAPRR